MAEAALLSNVDHVVELGPYPSIQQQADQAATEEVEVSAELSEKQEQPGDDDPRLYRSLHTAALKGDWESAKRFFLENPGADITRPLNPKKMTILHVAANMGHSDFIKKLVKSGNFPKEALDDKDDSGYTALHYATAVGNLRAVKFLISRDKKLTTVKSIPRIITGKVEKDKTPIRRHSAADNTANRKAIQYLIEKLTDAKDIFDLDTDSFPAGVERADFITTLAAVGHYDICLRLLEKHPNLLPPYNAWVEKNPAKIRNQQEHSSSDLLSTLVCRPSDFPSGNSLTFMERCIYHLIPVKEAPGSGKSILGASEHPQHSSSLSARIRSKMEKVIQWIVRAASKSPVYNVPGIKHIRDIKYKHKCIIQLLDVTCQSMLKWKVGDIVPYFKESKVCDEAAEHGQTEIIKALIECFPDIMDDVDVEGQILKTAIRFRQENVYNIMMERGITVKFLPTFVNKKKKETVLHVVAKLAPYHRLSSVSCPALQMQRELQWFKEVEKFVPPSMKILENKASQTPQEFFTAEHKDLVKEGEQWLKETSTACLVVATLIITVVFTAAFTIPGGLKDDNTGVPIYKGKTAFNLFIVSDAVGMFSSATSIFMFLSILTSRFAEKDFLEALPKRLILGLVSLLIAIASMMISFGATLYLVVDPNSNLITYPIMALSGIPIGLFIMLQLPLIISMVRSTYGPSILKEKKIPVK